jgi:hypothetical protein
MKILVRFALVVFVLAVFSQAAFSQQAPGYGPGPGSGKALAPENFPDTKARILQMLDDRLTRLSQEKACVEKAENLEGLKKCRPAPPARGEGGQRRQGGRVPPPSGNQ